MITSEQQLRDIIGTPSELVQNKVIHYLDYHCQSFIKSSPLVLISSANKKGECDVSPRGDHPGFVSIVNEHYLLIPERPGNKRADTLTNILENPQIGLLFVIPNMGETLRINGKAMIITDEEHLTSLTVHNKVPKLAIAVHVEECFLHCAKAFIRSNLWNYESWIKKEECPNPAKILADHAKIPNLREEQIANRLKEGYEQRLY